MTQTLNVEYEELLARATELEQPLPTPPSGTPQTPCALSINVSAAEQLEWNTDMIRERLTRTHREYRRLAESLRNAAKAYEEVDEGAAQAVATNSALSPLGFAGSDDQMMINCDPDEDYVPPPPPPPPVVEYPFYPVRDAAKDIAAPDQGTAFLAFANDWEAFQRNLLRVSTRFRQFTHWEGTSAEAIEGHFSKQQKYLNSLAGNCVQILNQARAVVAAHRLSFPDHPTAYHIEYLDNNWWYYTVGPGKTDANREYLKRKFLIIYQEAQVKSEEVIAQYISRANLPLQSVMPDIPPPANEVRIDPPPKPGDGNPGGDDPGTIDPNDPNAPGNPIDEGDLPNPTDMTSPSAGGGMPAMPPTGDNAKLTEALKDLKKGPGLPTGAGMKPASLGGGGGMPKMPLQPAVDGGAAVPPAAAAAGGSGLGRVPGVGGMGGGMGGMPMGAPGQGQNDQGKGKRGPAEDDALYTEDRAWTEGVIGRRRAKDAPEK